MNIDTIVVGVNFSEGSDTAVAWASEIAGHTRARVILVHAAESVDHHGFAEVQKSMLAAQQSALARLEALESAELGAGNVASTCREGRPSAVLAAVAEEVDADLVVVGADGHTRIRQFLLGSTTERVVRRCKCSVLVARAVGEGKSYRGRILVATDFSPEAETAVETAAAIAAEGGAIELYHAWNLPSAAQGFYANEGTLLYQGIGGAAETAAAPLIERHASAGFTVTLKQVNERARDGIVRRLKSEPFSLAVVGSHGRSGPGRWLLGSVAEAIVRQAPCSVLVARKS